MGVYIKGQKVGTDNTYQEVFDKTIYSYSKTTITLNEDVNWNGDYKTVNNDLTFRFLKNNNYMLKSLNNIDENKLELIENFEISKFNINNLKLILYFKYNDSSVQKFIFDYGNFEKYNNLVSKKIIEEDNYIKIIFSFDTTKTITAIINNVEYELTLIGFGGFTCDFKYNNEILLIYSATFITDSSSSKDSSKKFINDVLFDSLISTSSKIEELNQIINSGSEIEIKGSSKKEYGTYYLSCLTGTTDSVVSFSSENKKSYAKIFIEFDNWRLLKNE